MNVVRYGIPAALIVAGFVSLFVADEANKYDGFGLGVGAGLAVLLLNWLFRLGAAGDDDREQEEAARDYFTKHGRWPDEDS